MSEIHAAIGIEQLKKKIFPFFKTKKKNFFLFKKKIEKIKDLKILFSKKENSINAYYCMNVLLLNKNLKKRNLVITNLEKKI